MLVPIEVIEATVTTTDAQINLVNFQSCSGAREGRAAELDPGVWTDFLNSPANIGHGKNNIKVSGEYVVQKFKEGDKDEGG